MSEQVAQLEIQSEVQPKTQIETHQNTPEQEVRKKFKPTFDTNFEKVGEFHIMFNHPIQSEPQLGIFDENPKLVEFRLSQIEEELEELKQAIDKKDYIECIDAICDLMYFVYGTFHVFGVDFDAYQPKPKIRIFDCPINNVNMFRNEISAIHSQVTMLTQILSLVTVCCEEKNFSETIKYLVKLESVCHTFGTILGVDINDCFSEVHRSNMTKLCTSEEQAQRTVQQYIKQREERDIALANATSDEERQKINIDMKAYEDPMYRQHAEISKYWIVFDNATTKILKSVDWDTPHLADIIHLVINEKTPTIEDVEDVNEKSVEENDSTNELTTSVTNDDLDTDEYNPEKPLLD